MLRHEHPEFCVQDADDGGSVEGPDGEHVATFPGGLDNPAFLAFMEGLRRVPGVSVWHENRAHYLLSGGEIHASIADGVVELLAEPQPRSGIIR